MENVSVNYIGSNDQYQVYSPADLSLINTVTITGTYGSPNDYVEYFIKDLNNVVLSSHYFNAQYSLGNTVDPITGTTTKLYLDPETDSKEAGYDRGNVNVKYNFFAKQLASSPNPAQNFWIKEVSTSRTEIKAARQDLSNAQLVRAFNEFNTVLSADNYYPSFYLNFGADRQIIAVNAVYIEEEGNGYVIFKLYEPLPVEFDTKSTFWVVTEVAEPAEFNVAINVAATAILDSTPIQGPNFKVSIKDKVNQTTPYYSYTSLLATSVSSSYQQLKSMMQEKGIQINVDYGSFNNFIHFSSATERLYNFVYKLQQIETASLGLTQTNTATAKVLLQDQINNIITNFDGYEYYLYFTSESTAWPKSTQTQPYSLYSVTSSQAVSWLGATNITPNAATMSMYWSSSYYDDQNKDLFLHSIPGYIAEDPANEPYLVFLNMIGQHFDNIWIYLKDVTNHYSAENNPFVGISIDQVADALRSFGIQLYTNTSITDNVYYSLLGINQTGSALPVTSSAYSTPNVASSSLYPLAGQPYLTSSLLLPPFGEEKINRYVITFVTASGGQALETLPSSQIQGEIYKRLYHNLPYLLKTRGTERGIKALVTTYGIPSDILNVHEYGGYNYYQVPGIQEISNTRILTGSVLNISSSLLSPFTTNQYYEYTLEKTSNEVEVAFSPADSINASITSSGLITSSAQPGYFNIMQYIGAPNLQYSSSYTPLVQLADNFFSQTYVERYNVWDFIRVIKYYNNSLFKMIKDWVPARASANAGIVIKSHMLERSKYARHEPFVVISGSIGKIGMVSITGSAGQGILYNTSYTASVPVQYQSNSVYLGNKSGSVTIISNTGIENYTGEYSGSYIDIPNYFPQVDVSSYIYPWTSSVAPSEHGGANIMFTTYSINYLTGNVTGSVISQRFLDLDYSTNQIVPVNFNLITQSLSQSLIIGPVSQSEQPYSQYAQLQDYNYSLRRSIIPRYSGSYMSGLYYNVYTPQNPTYSGDISYGKAPVINYYSNRLGLFTQVETSSFIPGTVNASLAYFADVSGGLFELNQNNRNWQDLQNIFVAGGNLTIKQFDNKKYSNQVATDGIKTIYSSGYNYTPQLYFRTSASSYDTKVYFTYTGDAVIGTFSAQNQSNFYISGSSVAPRYLAAGLSPVSAGKSKGYIYNIFDNVVSNVAGYYTTGSSSATTFPSYSAPYAGVRSFTANLNISVEFPTSGQEVTYSLDVVKNGTTVLGSGTATSQFKSEYSSGGTINGSVQVQNAVPIASGFPIIGYVYTGPFDVYNSSGIYQGTSAVGSWISSSVYTFSNIYGGGTALFATSYYDTSGYLSSIQTWNPGYSSTPLTNLSSTSSTAPINNLSSTLNLSLTTTPDSFNAGDAISFRLTQFLTASNANYTSSVSLGNLTINEVSTQGSYPYAVAPYISSLTNTSDNKGLITLSSNLSSYYNYQQIPFFVSGGVAYSSSLYTAYGDINTPFAPQPYDKIILRDKSGNIQDLTVYSASLSGTTVEILTVPAILQNWVGNPSSVEYFLLLRRYDDEQNVIMRFNKNPGVTSYGFLIPNTISPEVVDNINTLQAAVQSQLLNTQAVPGIDTINGGSFS